MGSQPAVLLGGATKAESFARNAKDPLNLIQVMLAEEDTAHLATFLQMHFLGFAENLKLNTFL